MRALRPTGLLFACLCVILGGFGLTLSPSQAQFATNTPPVVIFASATPAALPVVPTLGTPVPSLFATSTPIGYQAPTPVPPTPAAPRENYALRQWFEADMLDILRERVIELAEPVYPASPAERQLALELSLYELTYRFPAAPSNPEAARALLAVMLNAPVGQADMRRVVRRVVDDALAGDVTGDSVSVAGLTLELSRANFDGDSAPDAAVRITARSVDGVTLYEEVALALGNGRGGFRLAPLGYSAPAVPYNAQSLQTLIVDSVNGDALAELVLQVNDGGLNDRLLIIGARNGIATELTLPNNEIRLSALVDWTFTDSARLSVSEALAQTSAPNWECNTERVSVWEYRANFYRPVSVGDYVPADSLGCTLLANEPLFAQNPVNATGIVESAILAFPDETYNQHRAQLVRAMLYIMDGQLETARTALAELPTQIQPSLERQRAALESALTNGAGTALDVCEAVVAAHNDYQSAICDVDGVLTRYFGLVQLSTEQDLANQLNNIFLTVREVQPLREVGRAERLLVTFDIVGAGEWAFTPMREGVYMAELYRPAIIAASPLNQEPPVLPPSVRQALLLNDDPVSAQTLLDNLENRTSERAFPLADAYVRAFLFDRVGNRPAAISAYYALWREYPATLWGQLARQHLERR